jgi:hypothetical protein
MMKKERRRSAVSAHSRCAADGSEFRKNGMDGFDKSTGSVFPRQLECLSGLSPMRDLSASEKLLN